MGRRVLGKNAIRVRNGGGTESPGISRTRRCADCGAGRAGRLRVRGGPADQPQSSILLATMLLVEELKFVKALAPDLAPSALFPVMTLRSWTPSYIPMVPAVNLMVRSSSALFPVMTLPTIPTELYSQSAS